MSMQGIVQAIEFNIHVQYEWVTVAVETIPLTILSCIPLEYYPKSP